MGESKIRAADVDTADIDATLTAQLAVAWAGEGGEETRLGWWRSDMVSEYGGEYLFSAYCLGPRGEGSDV